MTEASLADEVAGIVAAWFCRLPEESDHDLALKIIARLVMPGCDHEWDESTARSSLSRLSAVTEKGHPGRACLRTSWIDEETVEQWHRTYRENS